MLNMYFAVIARCRTEKDGYLHLTIPSTFPDDHAIVHFLLDTSEQSAARLKQS